jgi:hypothetical protein
MSGVRLIGVLHCRVLNDDAQEPALQLICGSDDSGFRAWLRVEQAPDVWATQEFEKIADGDWRLRAGEPRWYDTSTGRAPATPKGRAKLDAHVKRLPEFLKLRRDIFGPGDELVTAWDRAAFGPKSRRGKRTEPQKFPRNRDWRRRRRQGLLTATPPTFAEMLLAAETEDEAKALAALMPQSQRNAARCFTNRPRYEHD